MDRQHPVYTVQARCHDCYKCLRQCPVKAIRVEEGRASIIPRLCIACGHCIKVCPSGAKRVRDDLGRARLLIQGDKPVYVSMAPSWTREFPELDWEGLQEAVKALGFAGLAETAQGAREVSMALAPVCSSLGKGVLISGACPAAVEFIARYVPEYRQSLSSVPSPALVHCRMLRREHGDIAVVFIGPCVAKKLEADRNPSIMNLALTFKDLRKWWEQEGIKPFAASASEAWQSSDGDQTAEPRGAMGRLYPVPGGMLETLRMAGVTIPLHQVTGLSNLDACLSGIDPSDIDAPIFLEALACQGGCLEGPCMSASVGGILAALRVFSTRGIEQPSETARPVSPAPQTIEPEVSDVSVLEEISLPAAPLTGTLYPVAHDEKNLKEALSRVGKSGPEDELNCGACGYDTCRNFAAALLEGNAEPAMCASWMRIRATRKANALLRCMPSGVAIVDSTLHIVECNRAFATIFGQDLTMVYEARPGLAGAQISRILPLEELFTAALRTGQDISREHLPLEDRLLHITIFTIDPGQTIGVIVRDVTEIETRREQIACRAREVIQKNLQTVQEIACRLGEHMADTEILLSNIAEDYGPTTRGDQDHLRGLKIVTRPEVPEVPEVPELPDGPRGDESNE